MLVKDLKTSFGASTVTKTGGNCGEAQWSKRGGHDAINSNDSFMQSKWYQIDGLIKDNLNLAKFLLNFGGKFEFLARICTISVECPL